jgi:hypothetical protein
MILTSYKIRDRNTGLFKCKGTYAGWSKKGNTWNSLQVLRAHLTMIKHHYPDGFPVWWEIIVMYALPGTSIPVQTSLKLKEKEIVELAISQCNLPKKVEENGT